METEKPSGLKLVSEALRFFEVSIRLPQELQMLLCNRVYGLKRNPVAANEAEAAFRYLAGVCH